MYHADGTMHGCNYVAVLLLYVLEPPYIRAKFSTNERERKRYVPLTLTYSYHTLNTARYTRLSSCYCKN